MRIPIGEIKVNPGRREAAPADVRELADSIAEIGLLNPITVSQSRTLIAGLHRLEAAKLLGWTEIECVVSGLEGLRAELAEIDENFVRSDLTPLEFGELLLRRKEIYEALHPESKNGGDRRSEGIRTSNCRSDSVSSFAQDTAEKLGIGRRTVERQGQQKTGGGTGIRQAGHRHHGPGALHHHRPLYRPAGHHRGGQCVGGRPRQREAEQSGVAPSHRRQRGRIPGRRGRALLGVLAVGG